VSRLTGLITGFAAGASVTGMVGLYLLLQCAGYRLGVGGLGGRPRDSFCSIR
jgi:hypothetical protein